MERSSPGAFTLLENFGHSLKSQSYLSYARSNEDISTIFKLARSRGLTVGLRGAGRSYNDAALNGGGIILDLHEMNRILEWDPAAGIVRVEPGVTLRQLWKRVLPDGWWPPVVSGTMATTLGGCLGANIHGKNNFRLGTIGEHVLEFTAQLPSGAEITCSQKKNGDLYRAMIGGMGLLGVFTTITYQMKRVYSGLLNVHAWNVPDLASHIQGLFESAPGHNYTVGWLDATSGGRSLGRGQLHTADYLTEGEDQNSAKTMRLAYQELPDKIFGLVPKSLLHHLMEPLMNPPGCRLVNSGKFLLGARPKSYLQSHAAFHFLLDYIPDWEMAYGKLIQYQSFVPKETALEAWTEILRLSQKRSLPSFLGVTKRHRPDGFLFSHSVDGYSLALDYKVTNSNRDRLARLLQDFDQIVLNAGGRFYFAKNSETSAVTVRRFLGEETIKKFRLLKLRCDPNSLLESDLSRRILGR